MPDSEPVRLWRERFKLNLSASWKADVEKTVTDLDLWKTILETWGWFDSNKKWHSRSPGIKGLLTEYERLATPNENAKKHNGQKPLSDHHRPWLSERSEGNVSEVPQHPERLYFRADRLV